MDRTRQFAVAAEKYEAAQRRRFGRKREPGYTGAGYHYANYPNMVGAMTAGTNINELTQTQKPRQISKAGKTAAATDGMSFGGTATGFVGGLG